MLEREGRTRDAQVCREGSGCPTPLRLASGYRAPVGREEVARSTGQGRAGSLGKQQRTLLPIPNPFPEREGKERVSTSL